MRETIQKQFGEAIRKGRNQLGLSQEKFAERVGVHRTYIGMVERGEKNITLGNIEKFATGLGKPIYELFQTMER